MNMNELYSSQEAICFFIWAAIEVVIIILIVHDYVRYSDARGDFEQSECQTWYALFLMAWPVILVFTIYAGIGVSISWLCITCLKGTKKGITYWRSW